MKVLIILFSLLNFFNIDLNKKEINLKSSFEEVSNIETVYGYYTVLEEDKKVEILYDNNRLILINNIYHYKIVYNNDILTVFYKNNQNDYIKICKFNKGKLVVVKQIDNKFINLFDVLYYRNTYILVTSLEEYENKNIVNEYLLKDYLNKINAIIIQLNDDLKIITTKIYGGELNDFFEKIYYDYSNDYIYITGKKDQLSGYDFGNGGNGTTGYILCVINENLEIKDYKIFDNRIINLELSENIKLYTNKECFVLKCDLSVISSLIFNSESIFGMGMDKCWVASFGIRELKIYDFNKNICVQTYNYENIYELEEVKIIDKKIILLSRDKILKGVFYNDLFSEKEFIYDDLQTSKLPSTIYGLPTNFELSSLTYEENFDPLKFGKYKIYFNYDGFSITSKIEVLKRVNVTEGYIYPTGYNLFFSGEALLNGEEIYNNHQINEEGVYTLVLKGKDEEILINFTVCNMDICFTEEALKNWDYEVRINQKLNINFYYDEDVVIKKLIINEKEYDFINDVENKKVLFSIQEQKEGLYEYLINRIIYEKNNIEYGHNINYFFKVKVIQDKININNNFYNDDEYFNFDINLEDTNNQIRLIKIVSNTDYTYIPIYKGKIKLNEKFENNQNLKFYLVYDVLGKLYEEQLLFEINYDIDKTKIIGEMDLLFNDNILTNIIIKINNNEKVKEIKVDEVIQYQNISDNNYIYIIISLIFIALLFGGVKIFKVIQERNNKKY